MSIDLPKVANQICILRLSALGDCCHALGAINRLKKVMTDSKITWVIGKNEYQLFKDIEDIDFHVVDKTCLLYTSPSPRDYAASRMPSSA